MIRILKIIYHFFKLRTQKVSFLLSVNWFKTLIFNFKLLPFSIAKKLPIIFYGPVKFNNLKGEIVINSDNIKMGMIGFGQRFEMQTVHRGIAEVNLFGKLIFNGHCQIGKDVFLFVGKNAVCELGFMSRFGTKTQIVCTNNIKIGNWCGIGYESQISDSNYHPHLNTLTGEHYPNNLPICIGDYNFIANRVSVMMNTKTPINCVVASNSIINKDYKDLGENILIGGMPAKLIKENYKRDIDFEKEKLLKNLIKWEPYTNYL